MNSLKKLIEKTLNGGGDSDRHLMTLFSICLSLKPKNILEIGVRNGVTTAALLEAANMTDSMLYSVDIQDTLYSPPEHLKSNWVFNKSCSLDFLNNWYETYGSNNKFDLVYLDGWHSYDHVKQELDYLDKLVSPNSIILVHDLMYGNTEPYYHSDLTLDGGQWANGGPYKAIAELNNQFWEFSTIPVCNGLTVLRKKYSSLY
jgi:predicted O-methyltransferase YrrM